MENWVVLALFIFICSCKGTIGAGTLSGSDNIVFEVTEAKLIAGIDSLFTAN